MSETPKPPAPGEPQQIQIDIDEAMAQGAYSNLVLINHSDSEFILDFAFLQPAAPRARVRARILSSPRHTKRLLHESFHRDPRAIIEEVLRAQDDCMRSWETEEANRAWQEKREAVSHPRPPRRA